MNLEKKITPLLLALIIMLYGGLNAQIPSSRVILPPGYVVPYGIDNSMAIVSVGAFDNYTISFSAGFMETHVAVNRVNPLNFVATDNRIITGANYVYYTTNGGVSWSYSTVPTSQGDPVLASDSLGNLYLAYLNYGLVCQKSTNSGQSWNSPVMVVSNSNADKEWIACDQTNGQYKNNVYMAYFNIAAPQTVDFHRSTNNGVTWTGPYTMAPSVSTNPGPYILVDFSGKVYCFYTTSSGAAVRTSTDGGATFGSVMSASAYVEPGIINSTTGRHCVKSNIRTNGHPHAATDLTNGPYKGYVYICYASNPPGPDIANVYCARTTNGGTSWVMPIQVNDDATTNDQWMSSISVDDLGRVWMFWYDSRNDPSNILTEIYGAVSTDGGATFSPNFKISNQNFNPNVIKQYQGPDHYYIGDYVGISGRTMTFPVYSGQNNNLNDYTAYLPDYGVSFRKAVDSVNTNATSENWVRIPMMGPFLGTVNYSATVTPTPSSGTITFSWVPGSSKVLTGSHDSLKLRATVSSTVPYGTYTINVTGTEQGGPRTHTRAYTLIVANVVSRISNTTESPVSFNLYQNYPNPFNPGTMIEYYLPKNEVVTLKVYDIMGREVSTLVNTVYKKAGFYSEYFDAKNLASGIYYYKITAGSFNDIKKMSLIK
ncbi:T9SS C-terminal target domain-containing protein [bacterium]|nr:MAG: T9SS C-terminal target domain-containing protein [bacterium]